MGKSRIWLICAMTSSAARRNSGLAAAVTCAGGFAGTAVGGDADCLADAASPNASAKTSPANRFIPASSNWIREQNNRFLAAQPAKERFPGDWRNHCAAASGTLLAWTERE